MIQVNAVGTGAAASNGKVTRGEITVKQGETLSAVAKRFNMSVEDFKKWANLKSSSINTGQKIKLPTDTVPEHKGLLALAKKYGMTLDEFCKLNGISKDYKPAANERFYVKRNTASNDVVTPSRDEKKAKSEKENVVKDTKTVVSNNDEPTPAEKKDKYGSVYTPSELSENIRKQLDSFSTKVVDKPDFKSLIGEINSKNAQEVLSDFDKNGKKSSLINQITHQITSSKDARKEATMKIYDALASAKNAPESLRNEFKAELDKQFNSFGMVDTKNLDKMIDDIVNGNFNSTSSTVKPTPTVNDGTKVTLANGKVFKSSELQKSAITAAKKDANDKFKQYCVKNGIKYDSNLLDTSPMDRIPAPNIVNGKIKMAESEVLSPTAKSNGKVVILNTGHGGYNDRNGCFDVGAYSFIKKGNGKYAPMLEYEKMQSYGDDVVEKLRAQGYSVVLTSGSAYTMSGANSISNLVKKLNNGTKGSNKYSEKDMVFVSLHADIDEKRFGTGVLYDTKNSYDRAFADVLNDNLNNDSWIKSAKVERNAGTNGLFVLNQTTTIPSALIEVEYLNGTKAQNLDSSNFKTRFVTKLVDGINGYFGITKK